MVEKTILRLLSATYSDSFGAPSELCLYGVAADPTFYLRRWRVALMEESIKLVDFETVDQMVQVHGTF
jgi:hypothetical protein